MLPNYCNTAVVGLAKGSIYFPTTWLRPSFILKVKITWSFVINVDVWPNCNSKPTWSDLQGESRARPRYITLSLCPCLARVALEISLRYIMHLEWLCIAGASKLCATLHDTEDLHRLHEWAVRRVWNKTLGSQEAEVLIGAQLTKKRWFIKWECKFANIKLVLHNACSRVIFGKWGESSIHRRVSLCFQRAFFGLSLTKCIDFLYLINMYNVIICITNEYHGDLKCRYRRWWMKEYCAKCSFSTCGKIQRVNNNYFWTIDLNTYLAVDTVTVWHLLYFTTRRKGIMADEPAHSSTTSHNKVNVGSLSASFKPKTQIPS